MGPPNALRFWIGAVLIATVAGMAWAEMPGVYLHDLSAANCVFEAEGTGYRFDLCRLLDSSSRGMSFELEEQGQEGGALSTAMIRLGAPIEAKTVRKACSEMPWLPLHEAKACAQPCVHGSRVCLTDGLTSESIAGDVYPQEVVVSFADAQDVSSRPKSILLHISHDGIVHDLEMMCIDDHPEQPTMLHRIEDGHHHLTWYTPDACPIPQWEAITLVEAEPAEETEGGENGENLAPPPFKDGRRRSVVFVLLATGSTLLLLAFAANNPSLRHFLSRLIPIHSIPISLPPSFPSLPSSLTKPKHNPKSSSSSSSSSGDKRFRVEEDRLVRWAQEDMSFGLGLDEGEEDEMVNGSPVEARDEEQIPLKPSPGRRVKSYGTANLSRSQW